MDEKMHTTIGKVSLILGAVSILLIILQMIVSYGIYSGTIAFDIAILMSYLGYLSLPFAIIAVIFGYMARKQGDKYGLIGLILGLIVIILFIISIAISLTVYVYVSNMLPNPADMLPNPPP